jgi:hypothetical protein
MLDDLLFRFDGCHPSDFGVPIRFHRGTGPTILKATGFPLNY